MATGKERRGRRDAFLEWLEAFGLYLVLSLGFFGRGLVGHLFNYYLGRDTDPSLYMWSLAWWPHAISHHLHPLSTNLLWAPFGFNLAWVTCFPLLGLVASPLEIALGPVATYNIVALLLPALAAACAFGLCRRIAGRFLPALFAGFVFGFSAYVLGQLLSHLNQLLVFPVPILGYIAMRRFDQTFSTRKFVGLFTLTLLGEFLLSLELFALTTLGAAIAIAAGLLTSSGDVRRNLIRLIAPIAASYALVAVLVSPYLYQFFQPGFPSRPLWNPAAFSADLLNFVVPAPANWLGANRLAKLVSSRFTGTLYDQGACLGLPLILIAISWCRSHWNEPLARALFLTLIATCALAAGPLLRVAGLPMLPMPWLVFQRLPLMSGAMPVRMMVFAFLVAAVLAALWLGDPAVSRRMKLVGVAATLVMMLPNPSASYWTSPTGTPAFFRDGSSRRMLSLNDIVLPLPFGASGMCMLWQAESGMSFRMASGLTGMSLIQIRRWPVVNVFYGSWDLPDPGSQLKAFIANIGITAIVVDDADSRAPRWKKLLALLDIKPAEQAGVSLYRIPPGAFSRYRSMNPIDMETRAERSRFDTILCAAAKYVSRGGDAKKLTVSKLQNAGLLHEGWIFNPAPEAYRDAWAGPWKMGTIGVGVTGSPSAVSAVINAYLPEADFVYFPYPHQVKGGPPPNLFARMIEPVVYGSTSGESMQIMMMAFRPETLQALAHRIEAARAAAPPRPAPAAALSPGAFRPEVSR